MDVSKTLRSDSSEDIYNHKPLFVSVVERHDGRTEPRARRDRHLVRHSVRRQAEPGALPGSIGNVLSQPGATSLKFIISC